MPAATPHVPLSFVWHKDNSIKLSNSPVEETEGPPGKSNQHSWQACSGQLFSPKGSGYAFQRTAQYKIKIIVGKGQALLKCTQVNTDDSS